MAKNKKRRRPSLLTKAINVGILALAFARPIQILTAQISQADKFKLMQDEASAGLTAGAFDQNAALRFYGPMVSAIILKKAISMVRRTARV